MPTKLEKTRNSDFDVNGHIKSRHSRHQNADLYNEYYPGLATIELNISELCNRTCSFCPRHDPSVYPNQKLFMDEYTVQKLTTEIIQTGWYGDVHITGFGEPHTHPHLLEIVQILRTAPVYIEITTNGDRLIDSDLNYTKELFRAGLDMLTVDCYDGEEQYKRRQAEMLFLPGNGWRLRKHYDTGNAQELIAEYGFNNRSGIMGGTGVQNQCYLPFYKTMIDWNGDVVLCCNDWHRQAGNMGNILETSFAECWNSEKLTAIRAELAKGSRRGACANCSIVGTKFGFESFSIHTEYDIASIRASLPDTI